MKAWEKAKAKYPALSRMDFITQTCPHILGIADEPAECGRSDIVMDNCVKCWDRGVAK